MTSNVTLHLGDCLAIIPTLAENSIDAIVTDPPYGLSDHKTADVVACLTAWLAGEPYINSGKGFMGKTWDSWVPGPEIWRECYRVLKPGGYMFVFAGARTADLMGIAIRLAGFRAHSLLGWLFGSGFPKATNLSKQLDLREYNKWANLCKALDNLAKTSILDVWTEYSSSAKHAGLTFLLTSEREKRDTLDENTALSDVPTLAFLDPGEQSTPNELSSAKYAERTSLKSTIEIGTHTLKSDFAQSLVLVHVNQTNSLASALVAELRLSEAHHSVEAKETTAPANAEGIALPYSATIAESKSSEVQVKQEAPRYIALDFAQIMECENTASKIKADEALMTWLGSDKSSKQAATNALCAALTDDLKRIILSQSKTFLSLDTTQQMDFASATTVTITASTAESLISFTVDILRRKMLDKQAGAEREVVGINEDYLRRKPNGMKTEGATAYGYSQTQQETNANITAPATPEAAQWDGWYYGLQSLKPALEPILMFQKPADRAMTDNVLHWGTGAVNVDAGRVEGEPWKAHDATGLASVKFFTNGDAPIVHKEPHNAGRWPANLAHDGSDAVAAEFPMTGKSSPTRRHRNGPKFNGKYNNGVPGVDPNITHSPDGYGDAGSASRFFTACPYDEEDATPFKYVAKASKRDRDEGLEGMPLRQSVGGGGGIGDYLEDVNSASGKYGSEKAPYRNPHPTVKPTPLLRWLVKLITPPGGVILDPFAGSGSTGKACALEGFDFIGIERDAEYIEIAQRRILAAQSVLLSNELAIKQLSLIE